MSVERTEEEVFSRSTKIDHALILHCKLSQENVEQIGDVARRMAMSFTEAAVHVGLASPPDVADVIAYIQEQASHVQ